MEVKCLVAIHLAASLCMCILNVMTRSRASLGQLSERTVSAVVFILSLARQSRVGRCIDLGLPSTSLLGLSGNRILRSKIG